MRSVTPNLRILDYPELPNRTSCVGYIVAPDTLWDSGMVLMWFVLVVVISTGA